MWILIVEALFALFLFVFIVWWTMFSGRKPERHDKAKDPVRQKDDESL